MSWKLDDWWISEKASKRNVKFNKVQGKALNFFSLKDPEFPFLVTQFTQHSSQT